MIIRSIELGHWRGLPHFSCELDDGLNVICGPNEAGKSTLVEALHWALFQDLVGGGKIKAEIEAIIPAFAPLELPTVKVLLVFPNCQALVTKRLAPDAPGRECHLLIQRENQPDEHYEQSRAQELLWQLMSNDGWVEAPQQNLTPDDSILFSKQGKSTFYVEQDISAMVRSALSDNPALSAEGGISLSPRLESIRLKLQKLRSAQLGKRLSPTVTDGALKQSDAAGWRDQLNVLHSEIEKQQLLLQTIADDRQRIAQLEPALIDAQVRIQQLTEEHKSLNQLREEQQKADQQVSEKTIHYNSTLAARDQLQTLVQDIERHREIAATTQKKIQINQPVLSAATEKVIALKDALDESEKNWDCCQQRQRQELHAMEAWRSWLDVKEKQTRKNHAAQVYERLRELAQTWKTAQEELPNTGKMIQASHLSNWRERYRDIETEEKRLANHLRFDIKWEVPAKMKWRADDGEWQSADLPAGTPFNMHGKSALDISLDGMGRIKVSTREDKSLQNDQRGILVKRQSLQRDMARYGCAEVPLPEGFETLEAQIQQQLLTQKTAEDAKAHWQNAVSTCGFTEQIRNLEDTEEVLKLSYQQVQEMTQDWEHSKTDALQYKDFYPSPVTPVMAKDLLRTATHQRGEWEKSTIGAEKDHKQKAAQFHQEKDQATRLENELRNDQEKLTHAETELRRLCDDGQSDAARKEQLKERTDAWILADAALKATTAARQQMGETISIERLQDQQIQLQKLQENIATIENELATCRARLQLQSHDDPQNALEEMEFKRDELTARLEKEETRLRGLILLQTMLEAQRLRFGDSIAEPLNARLSPWLSTLRDKPTRVEFDPTGKRLVGVQTQDHHGHYRLNFNAHSGGMQEQVALLIRLIYLQMTSSRLPSGKLPVILDDPLTHTDARRRQGLLKVLWEAATSLQILYVSCHNEHFAELGGARQIKVPVPPGENEHVYHGSV